MDVQLVGFREIEPAWRSLEERAPTHPFQAFDWVRAWQTCVGEARGLRPCVVAVGDPPVMILPFGLHRGVLVWLGGEVSDYGGPLVAPECPDAWLDGDFPLLWREILGVLPRFHFARLLRQPPRISGRPNPFLVLGARPNPSGSHQSALGRDWEAYYQSKSSGRTRQADRRKERSLEELGAVEFVIAEDRAEGEALLPAVYALKSQGYRALGVADLFADAGHRAFLRRVTSTPLAHVSALRVGGRVVATHWGLRHQKRLYLLFPAYAREAELERWSPGAVLVRRLLRWACDNEIHTVDFTVGDEPYKERWCETTTPLFDAMIPCSALGHAGALAGDAQRATRRWLKGSPVYPSLLRARAWALGG